MYFKTAVWKRWLCHVLMRQLLLLVLHATQVAALEGRILRLLADYEVVVVTAGRQAEAEAAAALQQAQEHLAAVEKVQFAQYGCCKLLA
jgi:hypothetical protein